MGEEKLASASAAQMENTKKVMNKMAAGSDGALLKVVFTSWTQWLADYKKNKDEEEAIRAQERQMEEFMKAKKDGAKAVLDKMNASTDSGLLEHVISTWGQHYKDEKEAKKLEEMMAANEARFAGLTGRQKDNAMGVQQRVNEQMDLNAMLKHFSAWATDTKLERIMRHYNSKMESKKQQLQSVQHLFKNFAPQLDQGLKGETDSARDSGSRRRSDGVQLPEIQKNEFQLSRHPFSNQFRIAKRLCLYLSLRMLYSHQLLVGEAVCPFASLSVHMHACLFAVCLDTSQLNVPKCFI